MESTFAQHTLNHAPRHDPSGALKQVSPLFTLVSREERASFISTAIQASRSEAL